MRHYNTYIIRYAIGTVFFLLLVYLPVANPFCWVFCVFATLVCSLYSIGYLVTTIYNTFMGGEYANTHSAKHQFFIVAFTLSVTFMFLSWLGFCVYSPPHERAKQEKVQSGKN